MFPFASDLALDLMKQMIQFNPFMRPSVSECLAHPYLAKVRKPEKELEATKICDLELDKAEKEPSFKELHAILVQQIKYFKKKRQDQGPEHIMKP